MYNQTKDNWNPISWFCPNCGCPSAGYKTADGTLKAKCPKCQAVILKVSVSRRHEKIDVYRT